MSRIVNVATTIGSTCSFLRSSFGSAKGIGSSIGAVPTRGTSVPEWAVVGVPVWDDRRYDLVVV